MPQHPEAIIAGKKRPFTGAEFLEWLRDGREVYIYGERVKDVTDASGVPQFGGVRSRCSTMRCTTKTKDVLTAPTDTGSGGYTHKFFKAARSPRGRGRAARRHRRLGAHHLRLARAAAPTTRRPSSTRSAPMPSSTASSPTMRAPGTSAARRRCSILNHALVNPPIDRNKPVEQVKDVYITIQKETDAGIYVSGAKVVATNSALTHYNFLGQNMGQEITDPSMVVMFIAPMNTPGIKLICRPSYEFAAAATGSPWDYPLTSRFDENDAIFVFDNAFIPWENVHHPSRHRAAEELSIRSPASSTASPCRAAPGLR